MTTVVIDWNSFTHAGATGLRTVLAYLAIAVGIAFVVFLAKNWRFSVPFIFWTIAGGLTFAAAIIYAPILKLFGKHPFLPMSWVGERLHKAEQALK